MAWETASVVVKLKRKDLPKAYQERIARELVQIILKRTEEGKDKKGKPFKEYSDAYEMSDDFFLAGKIPGQVDLRLSGDMLADFGVLSARDGRIVLGFESEEQRGKAHGHQTGKDGKKSKKGKAFPVRDFLGISKEELKQALRKVPPPRDYLEALRKTWNENVRDGNERVGSIADDLVRFADIIADEAETF